MQDSDATSRPVWSSSFYWRIAISFVVSVVVVLVGQSLMIGYARSNGAFAPANPNALATTVAADIGRTIGHSPNTDLDAYIRSTYVARQAIFVVMKDGRVASNAASPLRDDIRRQVTAALHGVDVQPLSGDQPTGPVVTAPILFGSELQGMAVLPPPPQRGVLANVAELMSLRGTLVLIIVTAGAAVVIFAPARNRLHALESAAERLGRGDLEARAPASGRDEIARVATAFNRMAGDLAARTEALRASDRLRRQMLADVSHELRTPLTTMRGYLETLNMPGVVVDEEKRRRYLETVRHETLRLERIVADLLDLARFENNVTSMEARVVAVERIFAAVTRRFEHEAASAGVTFHVHVAEAADQIVADPDRLDQAISNLVGNALRHMPSGGTIRLEADTTPEHYWIAVIDSGTGIAQEHVPHVFDRFYKVDASRTSGVHGSGLGLSIVRAIVERHGGTITVASEPGRTAFVLALPRNEASAARTQPASANL